MTVTSPPAASPPAVSSGRALDLARIDDAALVVPLSSAADVHFAAVALGARRGGRHLRVQGTSVAVTAALARTKARMELLERIAQQEWIDAGAPALPVHPYPGPVVGPGVDRPTREADRRDATGFCAGPDRALALRHGLLEAVERDAVVQVLDRAAPVLRATCDDQRARRLLADQRAEADAFVHVSAGGLPTALVVARSTSGPGAAVGTACAPDLAAAVSRAVCEAVMMLTTARRACRSSTTDPALGGVVWAARHGDDLVGELDDLCVGVAQHETRSDALPASVTSRASFAEVPLTWVRAAGVGVWRVFLDGGLTFGDVRRTPWPVG